MSEQSAWFFAPELAEVGESVSLDVREARHAAGARRLNVGDELTLFDGRGSVVGARITALDRSKEVAVEVVSREMREPARPRLWLASALPKGDRQSAMLGMAAQLGILRFTPLRCQRSVVGMAAQLGILRFTPLRCQRSVVKAGKGFRERAHRIVIEACKQSRQPHVPLVEEPRNPARLAADAMAEGWSVLIAHPDGEAIARRAISQDDAFAVMIGPEGGFTDDEITEALNRGAAAVSLGDSILRIETAVVALLAHLRLRSS